MMDLNLSALFAGLAASVGVYAHGVIGGQWLAAQLNSVEMAPTSLSVRVFGDRDVSWQVFRIVWHSVTVVFLVSAVVLFLTAFGALESRDLLRFLTVVFSAFLAVGLFYFDKELDALLRPIPVVFATGMIAIASLAWVASSSV
jgi:hypothetical protein